MVIRSVVLIVPAVVALYMPSCRTPAVHPSPPALAHSRMSELWQPPDDLASRDLRYGRWGAAHAPEPGATYTFVELKKGGTNPGMKVRDPQGRRWSVKQRDPVRGPEGPAEVTLARILEAVGYHQPPVYYLPAFRLHGAGPTHIEPGGRFRLEVPQLEKVGDWAWQENPFVGSRPYQGLLAILLLFNSTDLKNANNTLYRYTAEPGAAEQYWYVVRDLGAALGATGRFEPRRSNIDAFERSRYVLRVEHGFVRFGYSGFHQELVRDRITPGDVAWAGDLLAGLSAEQWRHAFGAGGFGPNESERFLRAVHDRIRQGRSLGGGAS